MKKILSFLVIPVLLLVVIGATLVNANTLDYDPVQGNSLSGGEYSLNSYVETLDKPLETYDVTIPDNFIKKAEDSSLELYLDPESLAIAVRVKANGYVYSSYDFTDPELEEEDEGVKNPIISGISIEAYYSTGTPVTKSFLDEKAHLDGTKSRVASAEIENITNGVRMYVDFLEAEFQFRFQVEVTIDNGELVVYIPVSSIEEYNPKIFTSGANNQYYLLKSIIVFPYFGSTNGEDDGYAVLPDGSGMIVEFDSNPSPKGTFDLDLYGADLGYMNPSIGTRITSVNSISRLTMPIYGVIHDVGNTGFLVVSEEGSTYAVLNYISSGVINSFHRMYFSYRYRDSYEQGKSRTDETYVIQFQKKINQVDVKQRYVFLSGADADYVGVAKTYRNYLMDNDELTSSKVKTYSQTPMKIHFIGTEITNGILSQKIVGITTFKEMKQMIETLRTDGYNELLTSLKTYDMGDYGYTLNLSTKMGSKRDFIDYLEYLDDHQIAFSYYLDYVRSYDSYSKKHAQTLSKNEIYQLEFSAMNILHYVNDTQYYLGYAEDDLSLLQKYGITNVSIAGLDRALYTSYDKGVRSSVENVKDIQQMLDFYATNGINTNIYLPDSYTFKYISEYDNAPLSSSEYTVQSAAIPLVELVLSGYVDFYSDYLNFISDEAFSLLRLVEYGIYPSFVLTGGSTYDLKDTNSSNVYISEYDVLKSRIRTYYDFIDEGISATMGQELINHQFIAPGIVLVTYSEGTKIILNYNKTDYVYGEVTISALGYEVMM